MQIIIKHPKLGDARPVIAEESFPEFGAVGWVVVGPVEDADGTPEPDVSPSKKAKASAPADPTPESVSADDDKKEQ